MSLESLKDEVNSYKKKLSEETYKLEMYQEKVDALYSLYERMKKKKEEMKYLKKSLKSFVDESYEYWQGNVFNNRYNNNVREELLKNDYGKMLTIIDNNLDSINNKRTYYENLIYESKGIIGKFQVCINSIETHIVNWLN
ncbi:hypothetical protein ACXAUS_000865 [Clostridium sporogenes]|uniref:hypothetical protein n=1 Tax=Clostridium sporogenes TaxID=1509 RepID=UPI002901DDA0|nr:hypothetical protein [Clostridium botulinum]